MVDIIRRESWGARYANGFRPAPIPAHRVWLHHSVTSAGAVGSSLAVDVLSVRQLELIGQGRFEHGISYTFAVTPSGRVFEGHSVDRQGAHTGGDNTRSRGIVLVGNYDVARPTAQQLASVAELLAHGAGAGWWRTPALTGGHRDAPNASTACPGRHGQAAIAGINRAAATLRAAQLAHVPTPREEPDLTPEESRMLREVHEQQLKPHDYRYHHDAADDVVGGQVLATRHEMHELFGGVSAQVAALQAGVGQLLRLVNAPAGPLPPTGAPRG